MGFLLFLSDFMVPLIIFYIVGFAILGKRPVFDDFLYGAKEGMQTVVQVLPSLVGLMTAVGVLRASGFLDMLGQVLGNFTAQIGFPSELVPLAIIRMFSSSAATGLVLDIFKEFGTDSYIGLIASIMMSCTETIFYTISVYFIAAKVNKTRYTVAGAMLATAAGIAVSIFLAGSM